jgi:hypothetical protein
MSSPSALFFGPQTKLPTTEQSQTIRNILLNSPRLRGFVKAIEQLPSFWGLLIASDPALECVRGIESIQLIHQWLKTEKSSTFTSENNSLCTPLMFIVQVAQYFQYLENASSSHAHMLDLISRGGAQGFCTGVLAALSVSSSKNEEELIANASTALRLALCIGAYVDLSRQATSSKLVCAVIRSKSSDGMQRLPQRLKLYQHVSSPFLPDIISRLTPARLISR